MANENLPAEWADADQLSGFDLYNKEAMVDVPFRIFRIEFRVSNSGVRHAVLSVERIDGDRVQIQDSSTTGVCFQTMEYLTQQGHGDAIDSGSPVAVNLVCPRGLRLSEYDVVVRGKTQRAKSFYLTASGLLDESEIRDAHKQVKAAPTKASAAGRPEPRESRRASTRKRATP